MATPNLSQRVYTYPYTPKVHAFLEKILLYYALFYHKMRLWEPLCKLQINKKPHFPKLKGNSHCHRYKYHSIL